MQSQNYEKLKLLGEGTYGKCYLVTDKTSNQLCVLKQIEIFGMTQEEIGEAVREAHILEALNHPFIVRFLGSFQTREGYLNILMDYADGGDLSQRIREAKGREGGFGQPQILTWFTQLCLAMKHVHDRKIIHRDIKSQNIFLTKEGDVKLGDFGIAKPLQLTLQKIKSVVGTPYYMSPEICENKEYSFKTDIWSLGVILLEMCLLKPPFDANSLPALALKISKGDYNPLPKQFSRELRKLINEMLQVEPNKRPTINDVLKSPILQSRIDGVLPRGIRERQFSHTTLHSVNIFQKMPMRALYIDCQEEDIVPMANVVSPKGAAKKLNELGKSSKPKKTEMRRREASEPNLTPKNHSKIDNERKVMVKNSSGVLLDKKKQQQQISFKKKNKISIDCNSEVENLHELRNEIVELQGMVSLQPRPLPIPLQLQESELSEEEEEETTRQTNESILDTLQTLINENLGGGELKQFYWHSSNNSGICLLGPCAGLVTLAYAMRQQMLG